MSVWTKTEPSPSPTGPWFKAFVKKLKAWLEGLFAETRHRADGEMYRDPAGIPPALHASHESETLAAGGDSLQEYDPLADWTALVAEGAPELLIAPEEGGTPWQRAPEASPEVIENLEDATNPSRLFADWAPI